MLRPVLQSAVLIFAQPFPAHGLGGGALRWSFRHRRGDLVGLGSEATPQIAGYGDQGIPCSLPQQTCAYACLCNIARRCQNFLEMKRQLLAFTSLGPVIALFKPRDWKRRSSIELPLHCAYNTYDSMITGADF